MYVVLFLLFIYVVCNRTVISFLNCSRTLWSHSDIFQSEVESLRLRWQAVLNKLTVQRERYVFFFFFFCMYYKYSHDFVHAGKKVLFLLSFGNCPNLFDCFILGLVVNILFLIFYLQLYRYNNKINVFIFY